MEMVNVLQKTPIKNWNWLFSNARSNAVNKQSYLHFLSISDLDECLLGTHNCDVSQECRNTKGSFECRCKSGLKTNSQGHCDGKNVFETFQHYHF
jgi:hypothetical protein